MAHMTTKPPETRETATFQPYVPDSQSPAEFTLKAIVLGVLFGLIFGASTVYLGLRAGLTVSASIPIAVLAISVLKKFGGSTILENNITQTIGSAGESLAGGVVFTVPALIFLVPEGPAYFNYLQITMLTFAGGILGVLMMVPLRRALIVKEHGVLPYPEGTACAEVLVAGERGGKLASLVFGGLLVGAVWKALSWIFNLFLQVIGYSLLWPVRVYRARQTLHQLSLMNARELRDIGLTSYDGEVFVGLTGDRYAIRDLDVLAQCLEDAVQELLDATADAASLRQPTRKASPAARRAAERKAAAKQEAARRVGRRYPTGQGSRGRERGRRAEG